jgi:hypothetical protein
MWMSGGIQSRNSNYRKILTDKSTESSRFRVNMHMLSFRHRGFSSPFLLSFFSPSWRAMGSYRPHLEERDPICGYDNPFIGRSPSWGFSGFFSALWPFPGDLCTALGIISLSPLSLASDWRDTRGKWPLAGTRIGAGGSAALA